MRHERMAEFEAWWQEYAGGAANSAHMAGPRAVAWDAWQAGRAKFAEMF